VVFLGFFVFILIDATGCAECTVAAAASAATSTFSSWIRLFLGKGLGLGEAIFLFSLCKMQLL
jgi:hypothetical protein